MSALEKRQGGRDDGHMMATQQPRRRARHPLYYALPLHQRREADRWEMVANNPAAGATAVGIASAELLRIYGAAQERAERIAYAPLEDTTA